jgi:hypothetical protein
MIAEGPGDLTGVLILSSMLREDMPWLYELGIEAYRTAMKGPSKEAERAIRHFQRTIESSRRIHPELLGINSKGLYMVLRELEQLLMRESSPQVQPKTKTRRKIDVDEIDLGAAMTKEINK